MTERSTDDEELLAELLLDWQDAATSRSPKSPEQICTAFPDLAPELTRRIAMVAQIDRFIVDMGSGNDSTAIFNDAPTAPRYPELPGYQILGEIGRGGMGIVFKALQLRLNRLVAIKILKWGRGSPREIDRFKGEAKILAKVKDPGVVQIHDILEHDGVFYLVLEYVDGKSLAETSRHSTMTPIEAAKLAREIATILAAVHAKGVLHRDIKPGNILVDAHGRVKVTDFGIAKELSVDSNHTETGDILGSPSYVSPEQASGHRSRITVRTDVYAIGATLYELLTARPPFAGSSPMETLIQVKTQESIPPRLLVKSIPRDLETICLNCLEKEPERRYASAVLLRDDLERFINGHSIVARPVSRLERSVRWCRRNPDKAAFASLTFASILAFAIGMTWFSARLTGAIAQSRAQEVYARWGRIRERSLNRPHGWLQANLDEIKTASQYADTHESQQLLRTEALRCFCSHDVCAVKTLATGVDISRLAHHPTQPVLVLGHNYAEDDANVIIQLIDMNTHAELPQLTFTVSEELPNADPDGCRALAFTPSGKKLLVGTRRGWVHVWNTVTWEHVAGWQADTDRIVGIATDPGDQTFYSGSRTGSIKHWNLNERSVRRQTNVEGEVHGLCLIEGHLVVSSDHVSLLQLSDLKPHPLADDLRRYSAPVVPSLGGLGFIAGHDKKSTSQVRTLTQVALNPVSAIRELVEPRIRQAHQTPIMSLSTSQSGRFVVSADSNSVNLWDGVAGTPISSVNIDDEAAKAVAFMPDENHFVVAGRRQVELYEILQHAGWNTHSLNVPHIAAANISRNGQSLVQKGFNDGAHFGPMQTKELTTGIVCTSKQSAIESDEIIDVDDGTSVIVSATHAVSPQRLEVFDLQTGLLKSRITCPDGPKHLTLHSDRRRLYFAAFDAAAIGVTKPPSAVFVCDLQLGEVNLLWSNSDSKKEFNVSEILALSCGQELLATSARYNTLRIHRADDGSVLETISMKSTVTRLHLVDDTLLVTGDEQGVIKLLKLPEGTLLDQQLAHPQPVSGLAMGENNQILISACRGGEIRFWTLDVISKKLHLVAMVGPLTGPVKQLTLTRDGEILMILVDGESATRTMHLGPIRAGLQSLGLKSGAKN